MIADGLSFEVSSALKLKGHALTLFGFRDVNLVSGGPLGNTFYVRHGGIINLASWSHPSLGDLALLFDASHHLLVTPSAMGSPFRSRMYSARRRGLESVLYASLSLEDRPCAMSCFCCTRSEYGSGNEAAARTWPLAAQVSG